MSGFDFFLKFDEEDEEGAEILVMVNLGERTYEFLLDTGARMSSIRTDEFTSRFARQGDYQASGVLGQEMNELITLPHLKLGPIERTDLTVARIGTKNSEARNLIGMDVLKDWCCTFLFDENRVSLEPVLTDGLLDLFLDDVFHPYVPVYCSGDEAPAVWDTGASLTCVDLGFIESHSMAFEKVGHSIGTDVSGTSMETGMYTMKDFVCGGYHFPAHMVVGIDLAPVNARIEHQMMMILGYSTLSKANWIFDFPGRKWGVVRMLAETPSVKKVSD